MKRLIVLVAAVSGFVALSHQANAQTGCFYAVVLSPTRIEIHWCREGIVERNFYGYFLQRRNENEPTFIELTGSFCPPSLPPNPYPNECVYTDSTVYPGTWFYRVKRIDLDGTITFRDTLRVFIGTTGVDESKPLRFTLHQNYPNPFNPTTEIRYQTSEVSRVTLNVFDMLGREVATLVDEVQGSGFKMVRFDAGGLASGAYYYRITSGNYLATRKMIVIR
jgi:hypothetical protein